MKAEARVKELEATIELTHKQLEHFEALNHEFRRQAELAAIGRKDAESENARLKEEIEQWRALWHEGGQDTEK
jgi:hypothetical protein